MIIALQEVLSRSLQIHNGVYSELLDSIKYILDNLYTAFTRNHRSLFEKTLQALEIRGIAWNKYLGGPGCNRDILNIILKSIGYKIINFHISLYT